MNENTASRPSACGFYNPRRRHSSIGYLSPIEYEFRFATNPDVRQSAAVLAAVKDKPFGRPQVGPSLTAAARDGRTIVQAGMEEWLRRGPNKRMTPSRRVKYHQTRYPDPKPSTVHQIGASPETYLMMAYRTGWRKCAALSWKMRYGRARSRPLLCPLLHYFPEGPPTTRRLLQRLQGGLST
jgi:hypothetical protein